jgi:zinc protease
VKARIFVGLVLCAASACTRSATSTHVASTPLAPTSVVPAPAASAPAASAPAPSAPAATSYKNLKYPVLGQVKIPEPVEATLSNGMRIFLLEDHELPLVRGFAMVRTGNLFDPPDKRGLSQVMAEVMRSGGTKSKTGDQIDEQLENMAASVESGMDESNATVSFSSLKESSDAVLDIFKDVLTNPEFRQDKIDLSLTQLRSAIARRNDDPDGIPGRELASILYGRDTPYGWEIEYEHLARIKRDDLIAFYRQFYFPRNIRLAVYGDFSATEMKDKLEKLFADWKSAQTAVPAFPPVTAKPAPGIYLAEKPDVTQTFFALGHLGGTLADKDYAALQVASNILGQGFSSRLVSQIRTKLGYAYNVAAVWSAGYDHPGLFQIVGSTKSASTVDALQAIGKELDKIRSAEVTVEELNDAKQAALNSFVFFFDSPAKTLSRVIRYEYFGYPKDFLFQYQKAIAAVTRADVLRVAKDRFRPENITIVAVGNPKDFSKPLATLGKVNPIDLAIPEPQQERAAASPSSNNATIGRARELLQRAQQAMGGADKLAAVKDSIQTGEMAMAAGVRGMKVKQVNRWAAPDQLRQEQELPFGKVIAYSDGKSGWLSTPQGVLPMPPDVLKQAQGGLFRNLTTILLSDRDPARQLNATGDNIVEISAGADRVRIEFDPATGLPARVSYQQQGEIVETLSDWRETGGLKMPFKGVLEQNGNKVADRTVSEYKFNTGQTAEELGKKP